MHDGLCPGEVDFLPFGLPPLEIQLILKSSEESSMQTEILNSNRNNNH